MSDFLDSPIFGKTRRANDEELDCIKKAVEETPIDVFQALNRKLHDHGLMISIITPEELN